MNNVDSGLGGIALNDGSLEAKSIGLVHPFHLFGSDPDDALCSLLAEDDKRQEHHHAKRKQNGFFHG